MDELSRKERWPRNDSFLEDVRLPGAALASQCFMIGYTKGDENSRKGESDLTPKLRAIVVFPSKNKLVRSERSTAPFWKALRLSREANADVNIIVAVRFLENFRPKLNRTCNAAIESRLRKCCWSDLRKTLVLFQHLSPNVLVCRRQHGVWLLVHCVALRGQGCRRCWLLGSLAHGCASKAS